MKVLEMDEMCKGLDVDAMITEIGLDADDNATMAYRLSQKTENGLLRPEAAADMTRIGAMIGYLYAKKEFENQIAARIIS